MSIIAQNHVSQTSDLTTDNDLPEGWEPTTMGQVADVIGGGTPRTSDPANFSENGHPWITPADLSGFDGIWIQNGRRGLTEKGLKTSSATMMPKGTVLMSSRAPIGYVAVAANPISTNQGFKSFVLPPGVTSEYCYYWLKHMKPHLEQMGSGSTFLEISGGRAREIPFHLAPTKEQRRIAAKIEELLAQVAATRARLVKVSQILKRFRQAVLAAACSGRLTEEFRASHRLPDWEYTSLEEAGVRIQIGPFGSLLHRHDYVENGIPLINPMHIRGGEIIPSADFTVSSVKARELAQYRLRDGDVILGRRGEMGRAAVVQKVADGYLCGTGSLFVRPIDREIHSHFLCFFLQSPQTKSNLEMNAVGSTMINLNQRIVGELEFPDVDVHEQREIVPRVEALFKLADAIEKCVEAASKRADKLTQAILAKAFRGELVPTEAELARREGRDYESASVLLERIHAERLLVNPTTAQHRPRRVG